MLHYYVPPPKHTHTHTQHTLVAHRSLYYTRIQDLLKYGKLISDEEKKTITKKKKKKNPTNYVHT